MFHINRGSLHLPLRAVSKSQCHHLRQIILCWGEQINVLRVTFRGHSVQKMFSSYKLPSLESARGSLDCWLMFLQYLHPCCTEKLRLSHTIVLSTEHIISLPFKLFSAKMKIMFQSCFTEPRKENQQYYLAEVSLYCVYQNIQYYGLQYSISMKC